MNETESTILTNLCGRKKKKLYSKIRSQMEFYFSDSNLIRDTFLQNLIAEDSNGYVDIQVFKSFNKIKAITEDISVIAEALTKSIILEVNSERTRIRRTTPVDVSRDFDSCTLYVEKLPPYVSLRWIKDVFEQFGTVEHVNIPRYKMSQKIKGFAFILFSSAESVAKACKYYKTLAENSEIAESKKDKNRKAEDSGERKIKRRKTSLDANTSHEKVHDNLTLNSASDKENGKNIIDSESECVSKKRKHEHLNDEKLSKKKFKSSEEIKCVQPLEKCVPEGINEDKSGEQKQVAVTENLSAAEDVDNSANEDADKSKQKRKHKKKKHHSDRPLLRVMPKYEWKSYRNKYLSLQRSTMSHIKKQIMLEIQEWKEHDTSAKSESEMPKKGLHFQPAVIIKIGLSKAIENPVEIKEQITHATTVAYIDASLGHSELFLRCHTCEQAQLLVQDEGLQQLGSVELLKGTEEEDYWKKIEAERKAKFSIPRVNKKRGRDKLIAKATKLAEMKNKHIYFHE